VSKIQSFYTLLAIITYLFLSQPANALADGYAKFTPHLGSKPINNSQEAIQYEEQNITNGFDPEWEALLINITQGTIGGWLDISDYESQNNKLIKEYTLPTSDKPFTFWYALNDTLSSPTELIVQVEMPWDGWRFEHKDYTTIRQFNPNTGQPTGDAFILFDVWQAGQFSLGYIQPGQYTPNDRLAGFQLDFEPVPEPATISVLAIGALFLGRQRKRRHVP
jgi:hypothetical protein